VLFLAKVLVSDGAHDGFWANALFGENLAQRATPLPGLTQKRERLETLMTHSPRGMQRAETQISFALVTHNDERRGRRTDNQKSFFETGIEPREIRHVGEVFAVAIHDGMRDLVLFHFGAEPAESGA